MSYSYIYAAEADRLCFNAAFYNRYVPHKSLRASGLLNTRACPCAHQDGDVARQAFIAQSVR
ncbi:hypothetical protein LT85_1785 [Collimonas arenae]|uniref:Uncharacterized protein n=1 Tax=Collimonas arenae TaxID=279058 RepID=A0A0A1F892_9BURK|nr:hypothetical protein LT85_1785 [Collimonas arenae]